MTSVDDAAKGVAQTFRHESVERTRLQARSVCAARGDNKRNIPSTETIYACLLAVSWPLSLAGKDRSQRAASCTSQILMAR